MKCKTEKHSPRSMPGHAAPRVLAASLAMAFFLFLSGITRASADLDSEVYNSFVKFYAPIQESAARSTARSAPSSGTFSKDPTMALLHTIRNWDDLSDETRTALSRYIEITPWRNGLREVRSVYSNGCQEVISEAYSSTMDSQHFRVIYDNVYTSEHYSTPEYVSAILQASENIWTKEVNNLGLPVPLTKSDGKLRLYLCDIIGAGGGILGRTWATQVFSDDSALTYIELDNDYNGMTMPPSTSKSQYAALVMSHEFFHAIQFGISYNAPSYWIMESNATWIENEVYPNINDYIYSYLEERFNNPDISLDSMPGGTLLEYGSSIFFTHITENELAPSFVVNFWTELKSTCTPGSGVSWCSWQVTELPLLDSILVKNGKSLARAFRNYNVANYSKDYSDGNVPDFPDIKTSDLAMSAGSVTTSGTLDHLAADLYELYYVYGGSDIINITFSGNSSAKWEVSAVEVTVGGAYATTNMTISSGAGNISLEGFGQSFNRLAVIVNNAGKSGDGKTYNLTITEDPGNKVTLDHTYPEGWNIAGIPLQMSGSPSPATAFGLPGTTFIQLKNSKYLIEGQDSPRPGLGYWKYFAANTTVSVKGTPVESGNVSLAAGWNLVSPPGNMNVTWGSDISVSNGTNSYVVGTVDAQAYIDDTIYVYDADLDEYLPGKTPADSFSIEAWTGVAIFAKQACTLVFPIPAPE